jgi:very-short-patch-repair endonuclease
MGSQRTHRDAALAAVSKRQFGAFTREQALRAGFSLSAIKKRIARGVWAGIDHHVYRANTTPESWPQRLLAACLTGPAVASHRAAGRLWNLPGMQNDLVEVTALRHRRRKPTEVIWHESFYLSGRDVTEVDGIPCTRPVRTFLDLGVVLSPDALEMVLNDGIQRNLLSVDAIARRLEELGPLRRGSGHVRAALDRRLGTDGVPESVLETRFLQLVRSAGLPEPIARFQVRSDGQVIARLDFAYPRVRIGIELDGAAYHSGAEARKRDRRRDNRLGIIGWRVLRFDWDDVTRTPEHVAALMRPIGPK